MATESTNKSEVITQKRAVKLVKVFKSNGIGYDYVVTINDEEVTKRAPFLDTYMDYCDKAGITTG